MLPYSLMLCSHTRFRVFSVFRGLKLQEQLQELRQAEPDLRLDDGSAWARGVDLIGVAVFARSCSSVIFQFQ